MEFTCACGRQHSKLLQTINLSKALCKNCRENQRIEKACSDPSKSMISSIDNTSSKCCGHALDWKAQDAIQSLIGDANYMITGEACLADACLLFECTKESLPAQVKSSSGRHNKPNEFAFTDCDNYPHMLIFLGPISPHINFTLVLPGNVAENYIYFNSSSATNRWAKYIVQDTDLLSFCLKFFFAVKNGLKSIQWPRGDNFDISTLTLAPSEKWMTPQSKNRLLEYQYDVNFAAAISNISIERPAIQNSVVDIILNGKKIQNKVARKQNQGYFINLQKNKPSKKKVKLYQPYHESDFDFLCIFIPKTSLLFMIPMSALVERHYTSFQNIIGKRAMIVYLKDYTGRGDAWPTDYLKDMKSPTFERDITEVLSVSPATGNPLRGRTGRVSPLQQCSRPCD